MLAQSVSFIHSHRNGSYKNKQIITAVLTFFNPCLAICSLVPCNITPMVYWFNRNRQPAVSFEFRMVLMKHSIAYVWGKLKGKVILQKCQLMLGTLSACWNSFASLELSLSEVTLQTFWTENGLGCPLQHMTFSHQVLKIYFLINLGTTHINEHYTQICQIIAIASFHQSPGRLL